MHQEQCLLMNVLLKIMNIKACFIAGKLEIFTSMKCCYQLPKRWHLFEVLAASSQIDMKILRCHLENRCEVLIASYHNGKASSKCWYNSWRSIPLSSSVASSQRGRYQSEVLLPTLRKIISNKCCCQLRKSHLDIDDTTPSHF